MGWVSVVACAIVAGAFLYRILSEKASHTNNISSSTTATTTSPIRHNLHNGNKKDQKDHTIILPSINTEEKDRDVNERGDTHELINIVPPGISITDSKPMVTFTTDEMAETVKPQEKSAVMPPPPPPTINNNLIPASRSPPRLKPPVVGPAPPRLAGAGSLRPPPSSASSLRVPPQKVLQNTSMQPSSLMAPPKQKSRQVALEPGHSPLDWAALTSKPNNSLRGKDAPEQLIRVTPSQLKAQNGRKGKDAWTVYQGKVYNISPYVPFHPGGKGEILRGAGKDSVKLFMEVHPWVNWDGMLSECLVGILVGEEEQNETNSLDEMD